MPEPLSQTSLDRWTRIIVQLYPRLLGIIFIVAFVQKLRGRASIAEVLRFDGFPEAAIAPLEWSIVSIELVLGLLLVAFIVAKRLTMLAAAALLLVYSIQLGYLLLTPNAPDCGCLDKVASAAEAHRANLVSLVRNVCLIIPAIWTVLQIKPDPNSQASMTKVK